MKSFDLLGDANEGLSTGKETLKNKEVSYNEKWLEESENLKQFNDEKRANLIMAWKEKQVKIHYLNGSVFL